MADAIAVVEIRDAAASVIHNHPPTVVTVEVGFVGPMGPMGPPNTTPVSTSPGNELIIGPDGGLFVQQTWANAPDW